MSLFGDTAIEAGAKAIHGGRGCTCRAGAKGDATAVLDAAIAALDHDELIEKAARAIAWADTPDPLRPGDPSVYMPLARAALRALGLLPGEDASAGQREGER
jgi:hypothetical protein